MRKTLFGVTLILSTLSMYSQQPATECNPDVDPSKCTVEEARDFYYAAAAAESLTDVAMDEVSNQNRAVEVPDAFAGRIHNTYQDFLNLFAFAINKVEESENGQALTVRFNPFRTGLIAAGANLTVSKPVVSEALQNALPEAGREDIVRQLEKQMGDVDNLKWSASAALQTVGCEITRNPTKRCYGRAPETYRELLSRALSPILMKSTGIDLSGLQTALFNSATEAGRQGNVFEKRLTTQNFNVESALPQIKELAEREAADLPREQQLFSSVNWESIGALIDNQPQATLTATYEALGRYGGPEATALQFELQYGNDNLNAVRAKCRGSVQCLGSEIESKMANGVNTMKWVLSAAYKRTNKWLVPKDLGLKDPINGFDDFKLDRNNELSVKAQGGLKLGTKVGDEPMRADFSLEGQRVTVGDKRKTNRWVASSTFTVPAGKQMSIPLTVSYANKSEFLPAESQKLGVHIGITYRIPKLGNM